MSGGGVSRKPVTIPSYDQESVEEKEEVEESAEPETEEIEVSGQELFEIPPGVKGESSRISLFRQRLHFYQRSTEYWEKLNKKLKGLDIESKEKENWQRCGSFFRDMASYYRLVLFQEDEGDFTVSGNARFWNIFARDFDYLQAGDFCPDQSLPRDKKDPGMEECGELMIGRAAAVVNYHAARRQYSEVIDAYVFMKNLMNGAEIASGIKERYGRALVERGRLKEALGIFMEVLAEDSGRPFKGLALRQETIAYLIALGDFDRARLQLEQLDSISRFCCDAGQSGEKYSKLLNDSSERELKLYGEALHAWLVSDRREIPAVLRENVAELKQDAPGSEAARLALILKEQVEKNVEKYVYRKLSRAVELVKENNFGQALEVVDSLSRLSLPAESLKKVRQTEAAVRKKQAQEELRQEKLRRDALAAKWDKAVGFLDRKEYDEALDHFRSLLDTSYQERAREKINETIRLAATAKRQKAAEFFIKARDAEDMESKVDFLQQSRQLLLEICQKYPEAEIIDKVEKNLSAVEQTMQNIDPGLLESDDSVKREISPEKTGEEKDGWF